jgi:hypothetical protein
MTAPDTVYQTVSGAVTFNFNGVLGVFVENAGMELTEEHSGYDKSPPGGREIIFVYRRINDDYI